MSTPTVGELERRIADLEARADEWDEEIGMVDDPGPDPEPITCGCGEYSIVVSNHRQLFSFGAICPECGNCFGWDAEPEELTEAER